MAPPEKDVMGVRMQVRTDPPEDDPPLRRPAARAKQPSRPVVELEPESETLEHAAGGKPPYVRKDSPANGFRIEGKGWRITMPHVALVAVLTTIGGWFGSKAVSKGESAEVADVLAEVRETRKDVKALKRDVKDLADEQRDARDASKKILNYTEDTFTPIVATLRNMGAKLVYDNKSGNRYDPASEVDFHPPPLGGSAPSYQPKATLPERPSL